MMRISHFPSVSPIIPLPFSDSHYFVSLKITTVIRCKQPGVMYFSAALAPLFHTVASNSHSNVHLRQHPSRQPARMAQSRFTRLKHLLRADLEALPNAVEPEPPVPAPPVPADDGDHGL